MPMILDSSKALDSGSSLWILSFDPQSYWYQRLNWLTHYSLTTNELHTRPKIHPWLMKILESCEIPLPEIPMAEPLLVPLSPWLPADWLVTVPFSKHQENLFIQTVAQIWEQFQKPSLRLFLPAQLSFQEWENLWHQYQLSADISLVFEPSPQEHLSQA